MSLKITTVINSSKHTEERVRIRASVKCSTKGYALVDKTFDEKGNVSNEFRHIFILPNITLEEGQEIIIHTSNGKNGWTKYGNSENQYYRAFWGADSCVWNDKGDTATLIKFEVINSITVPAVK